MRDRLIRTLSTFFYLGYFPFIPGTFASLAGVILFFSLGGRLILELSLTLILLLLGFFVSGRAEKVFGKIDSPHVVIDEVAGIFIALIFLPYDLKVYLSSFILFRLLDTFKPYPAARIQKLKGGAGVMGDDIIAGLYTNIILQVVLRWVSFKIS